MDKMISSVAKVFSKSGWSTNSTSIRQPSADPPCIVNGISGGWHEIYNEYGNEQMHACVTKKKKLYWCFTINRFKKSHSDNDM